MDHEIFSFWYLSLIHYGQFICIAILGILNYYFLFNIYCNKVLFWLTLCPLFHRCIFCNILYTLMYANYVNYWIIDVIIDQLKKILYHMIYIHIYIMIWWWKYLSYTFKVTFYNKKKEKESIYYYYLYVNC